MVTFEIRGGNIGVQVETHSMEAITYWLYYTYAKGVQLIRGPIDRLISLYIE